MKNDWTREELEEKFVGKMVAVTIPVNVTIEGKQRIVEMAELEKILRDAEVISQSECYCRKTLGNCIEPMDGCLSIGEAARDDIKAGAKEISLEEALEAMERTSDAGLVHLAYVFEGKEEPEVICSCCSCCCHSMSAAVRFGYSGHVFESCFISTHDAGECRNCGTCAGRCQFHARELADSILLFDRDKCFGCGVCVKTCPTGAIEMTKRGIPPP
jgi:NAD-dependent dihydropyrimidine dehydrogenase PreA subunit